MDKKKCGKFAEPTEPVYTNDWKTEEQIEQSRKLERLRKIKFEPLIKTKS